MGESRAGLLAELIEESLPALSITLQALDLAKKAPQEAQRLMTNYGAEKVMELQQQHLALDRQIHKAKATKKRGGGKRGRAT